MAGSGKVSRVSEPLLSDGNVAYTVSPTFKPKPIAISPKRKNRHIVKPKKNAVLENRKKPPYRKTVETDGRLSLRFFLRNYGLSGLSGFTVFTDLRFSGITILRNYGFYGFTIWYGVIVRYAPNGGGTICAKRPFGNSICAKPPYGRMAVRNTAASMRQFDGCQSSIWQYSGRHMAVWRYEIPPHQCGNLVRSNPYK
jgi:hypothetical protein